MQFIVHVCLARGIRELPSAGFKPGESIARLLKGECWNKIGLVAAFFGTNPAHTYFNLPPLRMLFRNHADVGQRWGVIRGVASAERTARRWFQVAWSPSDSADAYKAAKHVWFWNGPEVRVSRTV